MIADHTYFEMGSYYYLANDVTGPNAAAVRKQFSSYGLCADEFQSFGNIPPQLYVNQCIGFHLENLLENIAPPNPISVLSGRQSATSIYADGCTSDDVIAFCRYVRISNRMVSDYVMTQNNIATPMVKDDSIAVGDWWFDNHMTGKYAMPPNKTRTGAGAGAGAAASDSTSAGSTSGWTVQLEGNYDPHLPVVFPSKRDGDFYDVPYKIMTPPRGLGTNLLVPVALSASAVAYSSTRIESMFMAVGSAAGVAAQQLVDGSAETVQDVNVTRVQEILTVHFRQQIHVSSPAPPPKHAPKWFAVAGAGDASWNGNYTMLHAASGGFPTYVQATNPTHSIYVAQGVWRIAVKGVGLAYIADTSAPNPVPPLAGGLLHRWERTPHRR